MYDFVISNYIKNTNMQVSSIKFNILISYPCEMQIIYFHILPLICDECSYILSADQIIPML